MDTWLDDTNNAEYIERIQTDEGEGRIRVCPVYPGITIRFIDVHMTYLACDFLPQAPVMAIHHCVAGRRECSFRAGEYVYLTRGEMAIGWQSGNQAAQPLWFPSSRYLGADLVISPAKAQPVIDARLQEDAFDLSSLCHRFCGPSARGRVMQENARLQQLFSELYRRPVAMRTPYYRLKVLEILLYLNCLRSDGVEKKAFTQRQVALVRDIRQEITASCQKKWSVASLAERHHISATTLKKCFKGIYGVTLPYYLKTYRMTKARRLLVETDWTILEIANRVGYENGSKFATSFCRTTGFLPGEYRTRHQLQRHRFRDKIKKSQTI